MKAYVFPDNWFTSKLKELTCDDHIKSMVHEIMHGETTPSSYVYDIFRMYLVNYVNVDAKSDIAVINDSFPDDDVTVLSFDSLDVMCVRGLDEVFEALSTDLYEDICNALIDKHGTDHGLASVEEVIEAIKSIVSSVEAIYLDTETSGHNEERIAIVDRPNSLLLLKL